MMATTMHPTYEDALRVAKQVSARPDIDEVRDVAAYAFDHQVSIYHAGWAVSIHEDGPRKTAICFCQRCERDGSTERIGRAARVAWSAEAKRIGTPGRPATEWVDHVNGVALAAGLAEARKVLAGLEAK